MPVPDDNGRVILTADIGDDAPIYNVKVTVRNANPGDNVVISVKNETNDIVSSSKVKTYYFSILVQPHTYHYHNMYMEDQTETLV